MCFSDLSSCNLIGISSSIAIALSNDLTVDEINKLSAFFNSLSGNLAILATRNSIEK